MWGLEWWWWGWSGGGWGLEWWQVGVGVVEGGVGVVACGGSSGGVRDLEWWHIQHLMLYNVLYPT